MARLISLCSPHHANTYNTTVGGGEVQVTLHEIAPCNIKDDIDFPAEARIIELFGKATFAVIRHKRRPERFTASHLAAEPAVDITVAPSASHLNTNRADAAAAPVDQNRLTR